MRLIIAGALLAGALLVMMASPLACTPAGGSGLTFGIDAAGHDRFFPIAPDTPHALERGAADGPITCSSCHAAEATSFAAFACTGCHEHREAGVDPDGARGMAEVHVVVDDYVYESNGCLSCHARGLAAEIGRDDHDEHFPIAAASAHAATSCADCHIEPGDRAVVTCTGCHVDADGDGHDDHDVATMTAAHGPAMADLGYAWTTAKCLECHARSQVPGTLDHAAPFPVAAGSVHAPVACNECHTSRQDRTALACTGCHTQVDGAGAHEEARMREAHAGGAVPGYAYEPSSCYLCHAQAQVPGEIDVELHARDFPIGAASAHPLGATIDEPPVPVSCETCHQDAGNYRNVGCVGCHAHAEDVLGGTHGAFPEYTWNSTACVFCHLGGQKDLQHELFPVGPGDTHAKDDPLTGAVDGRLCADCHASQQERTRLACTTCHARHDIAQSTADHGASMTNHGYTFDSNACFECHRQAQVPGLFDHEPIYPLLAPSGRGEHDALSCSDCHASKEQRAASLTCTGCHVQVDGADVHGEARLAGIHGAMPQYIWSPQSCVGCHSDGTAATAAQNLDHVWFPIDAGRTHALAANGGQLACADCHRTPGDYAVATLDCRACHLQVGARDVHGEPRLAETHAGVDGYAWSTPSCLECHPNGEPTGNIAHDAFPIGAAAVHASIGCTQCHGDGPKTDANLLRCAQCHGSTVNLNPSVASIHNGVVGFENSSPSCYSCHPNAQAVGLIDHTRSFPIEPGSKHASPAYLQAVAPSQTTCTACHASSADRTVQSCAECHAGVQPRPADAHGRVGDFQNTSTMCKACHANATVPDLDNHRAFPINHHGAKCTTCHVDQQACLANPDCANRTAGGNNPLVLTAVQPDRPWAYDFSRYGCIKCHAHNKQRMDSDHTDVAFYSSYGVVGCADCHWDGRKHSACQSVAPGTCPNGGGAGCSPQCP